MQKSVINFKSNYSEPDCLVSFGKIISLFYALRALWDWIKKNVDSLGQDLLYDAALTPSNYS